MRTISSVRCRLSPGVITSPPLGAAIVLALRAPVLLALRAAIVVVLATTTCSAADAVQLRIVPSVAAPTKVVAVQATTTKSKAAKLKAASSRAATVRALATERARRAGSGAGAARMLDTARSLRATDLQSAIELQRANESQRSLTDLARVSRVSGILGFSRLSIPRAVDPRRNPRGGQPEARRGAQTATQQDLDAGQ